MTTVKASRSSRRASFFACSATWAAKISFFSRFFNSFSAIDTSSGFKSGLCFSSSSSSDSSSSEGGRSMSSVYAEAFGAGFGFALFEDAFLGLSAFSSMPANMAETENFSFLETSLLPGLVFVDGPASSDFFLPIVEN
ncbi:hypothetical protein MtrunA17_Chr7g0220891 [Medicago truncatula]|uniref:Uncharacterized protein n=1 Tax=Medicago truncatula TaxID=3880 RepID=A0A396H0D4_MEDTR|nr:hypothetical protein MtrunA17_Chr7g0220891 [Medicago truncatula]